jgi:hypothetical protein
MNEEHDMSPVPPSGPHAAKEPSPTLAVLAKSSIATLLLACVVAGGIYATSDGISQQGDEISPADAQARLEAFRTLDPLNLSEVAQGDVDRALQTMQLSPAALQSFKTELQPDAGAAAQSADPTNDPAQQAVAAAEQKRQRMRLVWITLWDTDMEDGDVVRIDSEGYSRTVRLTKKGDTFAVPVPADGVIKVTGVKDGDGGGITVGLASGDQRAIFPIMSEGQELGLRVRMN